MAAQRHAVGLRVLITGAAFCVLVAGLKAAGAILEPVMFSAFLAILAMPAVSRLERVGLPDWLAVSVVFTGVVLAFAGASILLGDSLSSFASRLPAYEARLTEISTAAIAWLATLGIEISRDALVEQIDAGQIANLAGATVASIGSILSNTLFVLLTTAFMLFEATGLPRKIRAALDDPEADLSRFETTISGIQKYLSIKTWISLGTGTLAWLLCWAVGVDYPFLWGVVAFFLNYIPTIGSIIAALPPVLLGLILFGWQQALILMLGYVAINTIVGSIIDPILTGERLGMSSLVVFLSLVFWGWIWGPLGMFLSVPLTMVVKILLEQSDDLRWIAVLLGDGREIKERLAKPREVSAAVASSP